MAPKAPSAPAATRLPLLLVSAALLSGALASAEMTDPGLEPECQSGSEASCGLPGESEGISLIQKAVRLDLQSSARAIDGGGEKQDPEEDDSGSDEDDSGSTEDDSGSTEDDSGATGAEVAPISDEQWAQAIGPGELDFRDMSQGDLGDCYLLAALVSIIYAQPGIIKAMFVKGSLLEGSNPVFTAKFMLNGKQSLVAMNDKVPFNQETGDPYFAQAKKKNYWPPLIEKAWAKIFGNYKRIESGEQREVQGHHAGP